MRQIQIRQYPKLVEEFAKENFNLKTLVGVLIALMLINSVTLAYILRRGPMVVPLQADGNIARVDSQVTDAQIQAAVKEYMNTRYTWTDSTISAQVKRAEFFIAPQLVAAFQRAMVETLKYVHEKKVVQRVYARTTEVNFKDRQILITADRITEFDGLKAASEMRIVLNFDLEARTVVNPWGIYITKETEKAPQ